MIWWNVCCLNLGLKNRIKNNDIETIVEQIRFIWPTLKKCNFFKKNEEKEKKKKSWGLNILHKVIWGSSYYYIRVYSRSLSCVTLVSL